MLGRLVAAAVLAEEAVAGSFGPFGSGCLVAANHPEPESVPLPGQRAPPIRGGHAAAPHHHQRERGLLAAAESTDHAVWSTAGRTILRAIRPKCKDPLAAVILRAALEHSAAAGDATALKEIERQLASLNPLEERAARTRLALQFQRIGAVDIPAVEGKLATLWPEFGLIPFDSNSSSSGGAETMPPTQKDITGVASAVLDSDVETESSTSSSSEEDDLLVRAEDLARALVSTSLGGRCPSTHACEVLEDLLIDAVFTGAETLEVVRERTAALGFNSGLNTVVVDSGRTSVEDSRCLQGVVLSRQVHLSTSPAFCATSALSTEKQAGSNSTQPTQLNAVFLHCDFANVMPTCAQTITILGGHGGATSVAKYREAWIRQVLGWFRASGVGLLVCSEILDEPTRHECSRVGIAVCHAVPLSELRWSCAVLDTFPLTDITVADLLQPTLPSCSTAALASYHRLAIGGRTCTWLVPATHPQKRPVGTAVYSSATLTRTLTVAAADSMLGEELASSLRDAVKLLALWLGARTTPSTLKQRRTTARLVPGGGAFEAALSCLLNPSRSEVDECGVFTEAPEVDAARTIVSLALLRVPAQLYWTAHPQDVRGWNLDALPKLIQYHRERKHGWGIRPSDGSVANMALQDEDVGSAELISGKLMLVIHCVQLLATLLKIDAIVHTSTLLRPRQKEFMKDARLLPDDDQHSD